jgi:SNF2-related domain/SNF2 Helicase protein/Helicase conserved C-terminal domain
VIRLHATADTGGRVYLWGEAGSIPRRRPPGAPAEAPRHPFAAPAAEIGRALDRARLGSGRADWITLRLPSGSRGPQPSWSPSRDQPVELGSWRVPALAFDPLPAAGLLLTLSRRGASGLEVGASVTCLARAAELALALVAEGRLLPTLSHEESRFQARWESIPTPDHDRLLRALGEALPPVARAMEGAGGERLVRAFVEATVDATARAALRGAEPVKVRVGPAASWLHALAASNPAVRGGPSALARLEDELDAWRQASRPASSPLRTCFRLVAPEPGTAGDRWRVEFYLQAVDDPSLLVPLEEVWRSGQRLTAFERILEQPQEYVLRDLGRASRLWPPLEAALTTPRPSELELDAAGAYQFLLQGAPLLAHSGFGIQLPSWWRERRQQIGVRVRASGTGRSAAAVGTGLLGQEGLVDYRWELALGDDKLELDELRQLASLKVPLVQVRGQWVEIRPEQLQAALRFFERQGDDGHRQASVAEVMREGLGLEPSETGLPVLGLDARGWLEDVLRRAEDRRLEPMAAPSGFVGSLRPYQERGLGWLHLLGELGLGACLADDMGLGKTVQLLALLQAERVQANGHGPPGPTLLVCPMSVVGNWQREAERFAPQLRVHVHHGSDRHGAGGLAGIAAAADLVITTYPLVARDQQALAGIEWWRVVLDEAQNIKNSEAKQSRAVRSLRPARRVALTGTPVENRLSELWSIMDFCNPGLLGGPTEFRRRFAVPIERYGDDESADLLRRLTGPFVLRRLKTDRSIIADLPEKVEMKILCNITREQATLYQAVLDDMMARIQSSKGIERRGLVLATMMKLKQVLNHPAHLLGDGSPLAGRSGKLARLEEMLEEALEEGDRALLFTQFAEMGEMLRPYLEERFGREVLYLHGGTPKRARDEMVARFQAPGGPPLFILSLRAGGTGLNLTAANQVIHFDRWWNPAVEDQATDRAFRIGQRRDVQVRKLMCVGTLEERIDRMIEDKKDLAARIVGTGESWLTELSTSELEELVALSEEAVTES